MGWPIKVRSVFLRWLLWFLLIAFLIKIVRLGAIVRIAFSEVQLLAEGCWRQPLYRDIKSWYDVLPPRFILRNLKRNRSVYLIYVKLNFVKYLLIRWLQCLVAFVNIGKNRPKLQSFVEVLCFAFFRRLIPWSYHPIIITLYKAFPRIAYLNPILAAIKSMSLRTI